MESENQMKTRERLHAIMDFEPFDRLPIIEWATWWDKTIERWRGEGLPADLDRYGIYRHFGIEEHLYAFYDLPDLMHRMNRDLVAHHLKIIDKVCEHTTPDFMTFAEDMSYNNGSMLSKELFDEFMKPYYQMVIPKLKEKGIKVIIDSDGDISVPCKWFEEAGIEGILPLERQAGVDIAQLRKDHPKQIYIGAYDKMVMNKGEDEIGTEFERLLPVAKKGGFLISCDHQTPPGVSLEQYKIYLKLFKEYAVKAAGA